MVRSSGAVVRSSESTRQTPGRSSGPSPVVRIGSLESAGQNRLAKSPPGRPLRPRGGRLIDPPAACFGACAVAPRALHNRTAVVSWERHRRPPALRAPPAPAPRRGPPRARVRGTGRHGAPAPLGRPANAAGRPGAPSPAGARCTAHPEARRPSTPGGLTGRPPPRPLRNGRPADPRAASAADPPTPRPFGRFPNRPADRPDPRLLPPLEREREAADRASRSSASADRGQLADSWRSDSWPR